ncbi:twin-arginine translocation signal domain-containing protein, partial [Burkholderia sp. LMG 13014]
MQDDANNRTNRQATEHDDTADRPSRDDARASQRSRRNFLKLAGASVASAG